MINPALVERVPQDLDDHLAIVRAAGRGPISLPACPLMHGTGMLTGLAALVAGGTVVTLHSAHFDAHELWAAVVRHRVEQIVIVGDAFAKPMVRALDEAAGRRDVSCVLTIVSSGTMWSIEVKQAMLRHMPQATLLDSFGASEAVGFGLSVMTADGAVQTAKFQIGDDVQVFGDDGRAVGRGTGEVGAIARCGAIPEGYYKDPAKTDATFRTVDGIRYSMPGDFCTVEVDGTDHAAGPRQRLHQHRRREGIPRGDRGGAQAAPRRRRRAGRRPARRAVGPAVTGVVALRAGAVFDERALREHVRRQLAGYKTPKRLVAVERMFRAPNGKADYKGARDYAVRALGPVPPASSGSTTASSGPVARSGTTPGGATPRRTRCAANCCRATPTSTCGST